MSNFNRKHPLPHPGDVVEITFKKVSPKVQPLFQVGTRFTVERVLSAETRQTLVVSHPTRRKATLAMSCERYAWRIVEKDYAEEKAKAETERMRRALPSDKLLMYVNAPLLLQGIVLHYAEACLAYATERRLDGVIKKTSRAMRIVIAALEEDMSREGMEVSAVARRMAYDFMAKHQWHFFTLYNVLNQEYKRFKPDYEHIDLITNALAGRLLTQLLVSMENRYYSKLAEAAGIDYDGKNTMRGRSEMDACFMLYSGAPKGYNWKNRDISLNLTIIKQRIEAFDFTPYLDDK